MPELRTLVEHLVKTTVERTLASAPAGTGTAPSPDQRRELEAAIERALAPLVTKQRELETALADLRRTEFRPQVSPNTAVQRAPEPTTSRGSVAVAASATAVRAVPMAPAVSAAPRAIAVQPRSDVLAAAYDASASIELPSALNGSRRKRAVVWILAIGVLLVLLSVVGLAVLSNTGRYL
jgi:hypothetical protein